MTDLQNEQLLSLRPTIPQAIVNESTSDEETFQNTILRPVIKLASDTILATIKHNLYQFNKTFSNLAVEKRIGSLRTFLEKNQKIRAHLQGVVIGLMTGNELNSYFKNSSEYNKRIMQMIEQRAVDHIDYFK